MTLTLDRLVLREFEIKDWEAVHEYASDPEVVRYQAWGPNTVRDTHAFVQRAVGFQHERGRQHFELGMVSRADERLIGGCGIHVASAPNREGWIGYCLHRGFWGRGYATEAARALVAFGFDELRLHRIFATCDPANAASARVLEKVGMRREGQLREHQWVKNAWRDSLIYALLEHDPRPAA
jgi:RimJ/RimL family protein N-acetyltransferase